MVATRRYQTRYSSSDSLRPSGAHLLPGTTRGHPETGGLLEREACTHPCFHLRLFRFHRRIWSYHQRPLWTTPGLLAGLRPASTQRNADLLYHSPCDHSHQYHQNTNLRCSRSTKPLFTFKQNWQPELRLLLPCQSKSASAICSSMLSVRLFCSKNLPSQLLLPCDSAQSKQQEVFLILAHISCTPLTQDIAPRQVYFLPGIHLSCGGSEPA